MEQKTLIVVALALLVILSGVQAIQLTSLNSQLKDAKLSLGSSSSKAKLSGGGAASAPSSLDNLPSMVGGC